MFVVVFGRLDRLCGNAAPGLVVFEKLHHGAFGCIEALHQRANVFAFGFMCDSRTDGQRLFLRVGPELRESIALRWRRLRQRCMGFDGNGEGG